MGKKLYVGNLSYSLNDQSLTDIFSEFGSVQSARIIMDRDSGRSKGFAFVEMATEDEAANAIAKLHGYELAGRAMSVSEAKPMVPREGGGRHNGNHGGPHGGAHRPRT